LRRIASDSDHRDIVIIRTQSSIIIFLSRLTWRGASDQRRKTSGGERWPGVRRRCGAMKATGGLSRSGPGRPTGVHGGQACARNGLPNWSSSLRRQSTIAVGKRTFGNEGRLTCQASEDLSGANLKHRARDATEKAESRKIPTRQAAMSRGVEARGSSGTRGVPRTLVGQRALSRRSSQKRRRNRLECRRPAAGTRFQPRGEAGRKNTGDESRLLHFPNDPPRASLIPESVRLRARTEH
jgi:hypothetical protein